MAREGEWGNGRVRMTKKASSVAFLKLLQHRVTDLIYIPNEQLKFCSEYQFSL
jgi:hypothetical protein